MDHIQMELQHIFSPSDDSIIVILMLHLKLQYTHQKLFWLIKPHIISSKRGPYTLGDAKLSSFFTPIDLSIAIITITM